MRSQMTIGRKLGLGFGGLMALILGLAYSSLSSVSTLGSELDTSANITAKKTELAGHIATDVASMRAGLRGVMLFTMLKSNNVTVAKENFQQGADDIRKSVEEIRPMLNRESGKEAVKAIETGLAGLRQMYAEIERACAAQKIDAATMATMDKTVPIAKEMTKAAAQLMTNQRLTQAEASERAAGITTRSRWIALVLCGVCLLVGAVVLWVVRDISRTLRRLAGELGEGAEQTAGAAGQVSSSSQSLAQGSSEQAASLEETSASSEQINSMARRNTENSRSATELVGQSQQKFVETNRSLDQMVVAMEEINQSSDKIAKIIKVIDEIAFQTNILALNAAVEAARAGEAGMGFAVVADEVRNLAQRCAQAAKDTEALIEESIAKSNDGKIKVDQVATAIRAITEESGKVKTLVDEVNLGSQEQARGIEQIGKAISQMEQVTQKTAANAEESASAAEELNAQSETLKEIVERLTAMVGGGESLPGGSGRGSRRPGGRGPAPAGKPATGLPARGAAVVHKPAPGHAKTTSSVAHAIPLEEEFKEF